MAKESAYDKAGKKLQRASKTVGAIVALFATATGICTWVSNQFQTVVSAQISDLTSEIRESDKEQAQAITRVELMMLIEHDPENKVTIEKMAKYYFVDLVGNRYMEEKYSEWAKEYGGDISFVIGGN